MLCVSGITGEEVCCYVYVVPKLCVGYEGTSFDVGICYI